MLICEEWKNPLVMVKRFETEVIFWYQSIELQEIFNLNLQETIASESTETVYLDKHIGNTHHKVTMTMSVHPYPEKGSLLSVNVMKTSENTFDNLKWRHLKAINTGLRTGLMQGK